jgi:hypothetical protein
MMKTISETLVRLDPGQFDMETVAAECGNDVTPREAGKEVRRLNGRIMDGVRVKVLDAGRRLLVSLHNVERMHHYQRGRTSITGLRFWLRKVISTKRLVVVVMSRLVRFGDSSEHRAYINYD